MKLLLDEMYAGLKEYFETLGYEVLTAQEAGLKAAKDPRSLSTRANMTSYLLLRIKNPLNSPSYWVFAAYLSLT
jgi:hypothetical protein